MRVDYKNLFHNYFFYTGIMFYSGVFFYSTGFSPCKDYYSHILIVFYHSNIPHQSNYFQNCKVSHK